MTLLDPAQLATLLGATPPEEALAPATGVAYHSQKVRPGDVFFALSGGQGHGIEHAAAALAAGAAFVISDRPHAKTLVVENAAVALHTLGRHARGRLAARVIGITGSTGKTTVKSMVTAALGGRSTPGNLNTPPALVAALVEALRRDTGVAVDGGALTLGPAGSPIVLELGIDRVGEMLELVDLTGPDDALLTTVAEAHLSAFGDIETVAAEKSELLAGTSGLKFAGYAASQHLAPELRREVVAVAVDSPGDHDPSVGQATGSGHGLAELIRFELLPPEGKGPARLRGLGSEMTLPWPGRGMAENAALALAFAVRSGIEVEFAAGRLRGSVMEKHRLQRHELGAGSRRLVVIDDVYNSNPVSAALALETLRLEDAPRAAFLGDMRELGHLSRQRHRELGEATRGLDYVVAVGDEAAAILEGNPTAICVPDLDSAATLLTSIPQPAAVLFKASRSVGMERLVDRFLELAKERTRAATEGTT